MKEFELEYDYDLEETTYNEYEEMQVINEIRIGLMMNEITTTITKKQLIKWFSNIQMKKRDFCENVTCNDLVDIAKECGLKIV
ncbi:hypothetical protein [Clostridium brassicae]|uniref:Uncharacterized protein n=1 Tax=Clostridium brassicae TaxID=2999072 RepID=A0ABT4D6G0_9CLOT|nr:hypothetical protein [Clostridium brassicae]MCY6957872.1 hypothetical protein [Clostridium brassicae]